MAPTVLVAGHVTLDRYGGELLPGGTAYYATRAYLALGAASVRVATAAGPDFPRAALDGAEVELRRGPRTTTFRNTYGPGGLRDHRVDAIAPPVDPARVPAAWLASDVVHLGPIIGEIPVGAWVRAARGAGARVVGIGVQGWVRAVEPDGHVAQPRWEFAAAELAGVHAACVGEDDLVGQGDLLDRLAAVVPLVAFTHGKRGCDLILRGRTVRVGAFVTHESDPTGAGDVFAAGLFVGLAAGADPAEAARLGAAAASIVVEERAGAALGRIGEARARIAAVPVLAR